MRTWRTQIIWNVQFLFNCRFRQVSFEYKADADRLCILRCFLVYICNSLTEDPSTEQILGWFVNYFLVICSCFHLFWHLHIMFITNFFLSLSLSLSLTIPSFAKVSVNTVDGFQGCEKDVVLLSCVRGCGKGATGVIGSVFTFIGLEKPPYDCKLSWACRMSTC